MEISLLFNCILSQFLASPVTYTFSEVAPIHFDTTLFLLPLFIESFLQLTNTSLKGRFLCLTNLFQHTSIVLPNLEYMLDISILNKLIVCLSPLWDCVIICILNQPLFTCTFYYELEQNISTSTTESSLQSVSTPLKGPFIQFSTYFHHLVDFGIHASICDE